MAKLKKIENAPIQSATFQDVKSWYGQYVHPDGLDMGDQHVFKHIYHDGRWAGIFQVTQAGAQKFFERGKPENIVDIASLTSIYRPGPLAAKVDDLYVKAKSDPESVIYEHPLIKDTLKVTYNCIIFQEQLMKLGHVVGGLSLDDCDKLRKVITKRSVSGADKAKEEAKKLEKKFIVGAVERGVDEKVATELFEKMAYFSGYGFNFTITDTTLVTLYKADGTIIGNTEIRNISPEDIVMSYDQETKENVLTKVLNIHDHGKQDVYRFTMEDGSEVECSMEHKFRTSDGRMLPIRQILFEDLEIVCYNELSEKNKVRQLPSMQKKTSQRQSNC